jgi:hypothetical protein
MSAGLIQTRTLDGSDKAPLRRLPVNRRGVDIVFLDHACHGVGKGERQRIAVVGRGETPLPHVVLGLLAGLQT